MFVLTLVISSLSDVASGELGIRIADVNIGLKLEAL